jgi:hypothetical protein
MIEVLAMLIMLPLAAVVWFIAIELAMDFYRSYKNGGL